MKVSIFRLDAPSYEEPTTPVDSILSLTYTVPILPAFAILETKLELDYVFSDYGYRPPDYRVEIDRVVVNVAGIGMERTPRGGFLSIYHTGVRDYTLLFPQIKNAALRERLGQFALEADSTFESQSWMSYVVMVGAILEGMLIDHFQQRGFARLISRATSAQIITAQEKAVFNEVRQLRNRVHPGLYEEPFADRQTALDLSLIYEKLLKRDWAVQK